MNFSSATTKTVKRSSQMTAKLNEYSNSQPLPSSADNINQNQCQTLNPNQVPNSSLVAFLPDSSEMPFKNNYPNSLRFVNNNVQQNCNLANIVPLNASNFPTRPMAQANVLPFVQQQQPQPVPQSLAYNVPNNYRQLTKGSLANLNAANAKMTNSLCFEMPTGFNYSNHLEFAPEYQRQISNQSHHHPWCGKVDYLRKHNLNAFLSNVTAQQTAQSIRYSTAQLSVNSANTNYDFNRSHCYPMGNYSPRFPAALIQARNKILSAGYENAFHEIQNLINPYLIVHQRLMSEQLKYNNNNVQQQQNTNAALPSYLAGDNNTQVSALNEISSLNPHANSFFPIQQQQLDTTKAMLDYNNKKCFHNNGSLSSESNIQLQQQPAEYFSRKRESIASPEKVRCAPVSVCEEFVPPEINFNKFVSMLVDDLNDAKESEFDFETEELFDLTSKSSHYDDYDNNNDNKNGDGQFEDNEIYLLNNQQVFRQRDRGGSFNSSSIVGQLQPSIENYFHDRRPSTTSLDESPVPGRMRANTISVNAKEINVAARQRIYNRMDRYRPDRYKTELCLFMLETGNCPKYGDNCCFAHSLEELRQRPKHDLKEGTKPCDEYCNIEEGHICYRGSSRCWFLHPKPEFNFERLTADLRHWLKMPFNPKLLTSVWFDENFNPILYNQSQYRSRLPIWRSGSAQADSLEFDFGDEELNNNLKFHLLCRPLIERVISALYPEAKNQEQSILEDSNGNNDNSDRIIHYNWQYCGTSASNSLIRQKFYSVPLKTNSG